MLNIRRFGRIAGIALVPLILIGCDEEETTEEQVEVARPVKTIVIGQSTGDNVRRFPARIESSQRAELSFRVPGKVAEILVGEGERVATGTPIARLESTDFQLVVDDKQAVYDQAEAEFKRTETLLDRGFATRQRFEESQAEFQSAASALRLAKQDLSYTELSAPFEGEVARRFVENFEDVQAKQPIVSMRNTQSLEVKFDVPEQIMIQASESETAVEPNVTATFSVAPDQSFPLVFKEAAAFADPDTQTFEVTYLMPSPEELSVLPGMTATAIVDFGAAQEAESNFFVPVEAVVASNDLSPRIWVVDEDALTVGPRDVAIGDIRAGQIRISSGLEKGDRVVIAGVPFLVEGMAVSVMPDIEQAAERLDDAEIRRAAEANDQDADGDQAEEQDAQ